MRRLLAAAILLLATGIAVSGESNYGFEGVGRVVAFADVHGAYTELVSLLRETTIVDESLRWRAGRTHLVSLGDLVDRGPDSRKVLDLLMRLEEEAKSAGGAVHVVLGNHEVMNIVGDLRYVSAEEYAAFAGEDEDALREAAWHRIQAADPAASRPDFDREFPNGYFAHRRAFSGDGDYGRWLRSKPFVVVIDGTAFVHGGLSPMVARLGLEGTNEALHAELDRYLGAWQAIRSELGIVAPVPFQDRPDAVAALGADHHSGRLRELQDGELFTPSGPSWYRGQAFCYPLTETENLESALARLGAKRVVVGHTVPAPGRVLSRFDGRVILLDAGMLHAVYRGRPAALIVEGDRTSVAFADRPGLRAQPEVLPRAVGPRPRGLDDDALESWLAEAEIVAIEALGTGITEPERVTLRKDGVELRAVFKRVSVAFDDSSRARSQLESDRYQYELAAYRLDRLLGLDMVPVTVPRTIKGRRGVLQFWIDGAINLRQMLAENRPPSGWCEMSAQYNLMNVFDVLIHNADRTQENALVTRDGILVLIDHTRAFATHSQAPVLLYKGELHVPAALASRLEGLDRPALEQALGDYLHRRQIDAILKRRDRLLSGDRLSVSNIRRAAQ